MLEDEDVHDTRRYCIVTDALVHVTSCHVDGGVSSCGILRQSLGSVQVVGFFDVAARLCTGDGPVAALVGTASLGGGLV